MSAITVSLVEDEPHVATMLLQLLGKADGFRVASRHANAEDALAAVPEIAPRVVLVDLKLPGMDGASLIRRLKTAHPEMLFLVITQFDDGDLLFDALQAGANGYLLKRASDAEIIDAIRTVADGGGAMSPSICRKVLDHFQNLTPTTGAQSNLSDREIELLQLARRGKRAKEIALTMNLSYETVRTHFRNIYRKLHVHSLRSAVQKTFKD
jgi:DNA-binding NarL/FixJ family response regulator